MQQLLYRIIYSDKINLILRNINKTLYPILPSKIRLPPSGILNIDIRGKKLKIRTNQTNYLTHVFSGMVTGIMNIQTIF